MKIMQLAEKEANLQDLEEQAVVDYLEVLLVKAPLYLVLQHQNRVVLEVPLLLQLCNNFL